jgi:hypothetical protein
MKTKMLLCDTCNAGWHLNCLVPPLLVVPLPSLVCHSPFDEDKLLLCDTCNAGWHLDCLVPPLMVVTLSSWSCLLCSTPPSSPLPY